MSPKKLFVFGLGYSASRAARAFHSVGYSVSGTVRSIEAATQLSQSDPEKFRFDTSETLPQNVFLFDGERWSDSNSLSLEEALKGVTHVLISVPTGRVDGQEDPVFANLGDQLIRATKDSVQWVGYLSTIGVYGETNGVAVDESARVGSSVKRSQMRIKAERLWLDSGLPAHVFRIAGIYGPGRGTITKVRSGTASRIHIPGRVFNRIHVDDIVNILLASAEKPNPGGIYNMCDDEPAPADQVTAYACELLGVPVPPSQSWEEAEKNMSAMAKSFYAESKICVNRRIKEELRVKLIYPTYREGLLAQVLEEEKLACGETGNGAWSPAAAGQRLAVLVNIGSLRAEPYLDLRQISFRLSRALGQPVVPCSFRFSNRVDPQELNGLEAKTFEEVLTEHIAARGPNASEVVVLPLFFGKSSTLTEFLPKTINKVWAAATPAPLAPLTVRVGGCLVDQENANDTRVAQILLERIREVVDFETVNEDVTVLVIDHGTPNRDVHESREFVTEELRGLLKPYQSVKLVDTACMERREGAEYDFNDPLLSVALDHYTVEKGIVVCAKMFFSNGRHAGEKGDIEEIIDDVRARHPGVDVRVTGALGTHELLSEILHDRYRAVLSKESPDYTLTKSSSE
ncbi:NAD-dependent epimerase/dehydratase [Phytophthora megakarya]|uniref:NAD-dependent epimerase/dehydratase n=1 Tax=Phytophthora megakarya TaxID=4795 RepID=A0A225W1S3_9STRA|nr:NAD-dependent epimerase/dehydratase [Phytophthora megakarya]